MEKVKKFDSSVVPYLLAVKPSRYWVDYDEVTDTLYVSFRKPQCANDSVMEDDFVYHYSNDELVGVTILNAKQVTSK
jgi:uncharacterized protein YuzE